MIDENPLPPVESVDLDDYVPVLEAWHEANQKIKQLQADIDKYKTLLGKIMGTATEGRVGGQKVLTFAPVEAFNGEEFRKRYPETYRFFVHEVTKKQFDKELLRQTRPDLWEEFQSRPMKSTYVPGDKAQ